MSMPPPIIQENKFTDCDRTNSDESGKQPTRRRVLAFLKQTTTQYNERQQYRDSAPQSRRKGRPRRSTMTSKEKAYKPFKTPALESLIRKDPRFPDTDDELVRANAENEDASFDKADTRPLSYALDASGIPTKNALNISELLTQHRKEGYPALLSANGIFRFRPWVIVELRERLPPIEWTAGFRLKLDLVVHVMDWLNLRKYLGVERDIFLALVRVVLEDLKGRSRLVGMVGVVVETVRVEYVISEIQARFTVKGKTVLAKCSQTSKTLSRDETLKGLAQPSRDHGDAADTERQDKAESEREVLPLKIQELANLETATCLLVWLWFLKGVPGRFLAGGVNEIDVPNIRRVFREEEDEVTIPSGGVVLLGE
jgi:hypothetical protein